MSEFRDNKDRDSEDRIKIRNRAKELSKSEPFNEIRKSRVRRINPYDLTIRRAKVAEALRPYLGKIVSLTLMTEGNKRKKGWFLVLRFEFQSVVLREEQMNFVKLEKIQESKESVVPLEKVYYIFDGKKGIWPQRQALAFDFNSSNLGMNKSD